MIENAQESESFVKTWLIDRIAYPAVGFAILIGLWAIGGWFLEANPATSSFVKFGLVPTLQAVPGLVDGMWRMHARYGRMPWADLLAPAVALARENNIPIIVYSIHEKGGFAEILQGRGRATIVSDD